MASRKKKRSKRRSSRHAPIAPIESRNSEVLTVGWTVTLTTLFFCNLAAIGAHFYAEAHPEAQRMATLRELLLFACIVTGLLSLVLCALVHRLRETLPPRRLVAFGVCLALAPIMAVVLRAIR
jgi:hypothetical protein